MNCHAAGHGSDQRHSAPGAVRLAGRKLPAMKSTGVASSGLEDSRKKLAHPESGKVTATSVVRPPFPFPSGHSRLAIHTRASSITFSWKKNDFSRLAHAPA